MGRVFGDEVMAAALINLVHHCLLVTIRSNSNHMRQHAELWRTFHGRTA